ncbi:MAG: tetratricopeptide repeat protein [Pyrinomonadaceae bacterium]
MEDTLSNKVIEVLLPQLTGSEREEFSKRGTKNAEAFEKYLRGRFYFNSFTEDGFAKAFVSFHEAIAIDPNYAHAYAGIADYYNWLGIFGVLPPQECFQSAIAAAARAIEIDENLSEGHASFGFSQHAGNYDWSKAEHHLSRALELNPNNATAYVWYSIVLYTEARFAEGLEFARRGIELDPLTPFNIHNLGWGFYYARRYEDGSNQYKKLIADFPTYGLGYYGLSKIYRIIGKTVESVDEIQKAKEVFNDSVFSLLSEAESYAADGQRVEAEDKLSKLLELSESRFVSPYQLSLVYCYLNEKEKALELLKKALEIKEAWLNWIGVEPVFDVLRADERFQNILESIGYHYFFNNFSVSNRNFAKPSEDTEITDENNNNLTPATQNYTFHNETTLQLQTSEKTDDGLTEAVSEKPAKFRRKTLIYTLAGILLLAFGAGILQLAVKYGFYNGSKSAFSSSNKRDRDGSELEFRRAVQINPSYAQAHHWFSLTLSAMKRPTEAISEAQTADQLDPRSSAVKSALGQAYFYAGQYEEGLQTSEKAIALNEDFVPAHKTKRWIYQAMGNYEATLAAYRKEYSYSGGNNEPGWTIIKSQVEALGGNRDKTLSDLKQAIETPEVKNNPFAYAEEIALAFNALGDKESALLWLEKADAANNHGFNFMNADPRLENLQNERRFQKLVKKLETAKN